MQRLSGARGRLARAGLAVVVVLGVVAVAAGAGVVLARGPAGTPASAGPPPVRTGTLSPGTDAADAITRARQRLAAVPRDWAAWADLGLAYVQQARITGDPAYYAKADGVLHRSLQLQPDGNPQAYVGLGALAAARHDFAGALRYGERAVRIDDASAAGWGVVFDARIELGRYRAAAVAVQRMLDVRPDTSSLTRASYLLELRGDLTGALAMLDRALQNASTVADAGYVAYC